MSTPEGRVKAQVKKLLKEYEPRLRCEWPVPSGMGAPMLDANGCFKGFCFRIETKAPGKKPTEQQAITIARWEATGCMVFVIDGDLTILKAWLDMIDAFGQ